MQKIFLNADFSIYLSFFYSFLNANPTKRTLLNIWGMIQQTLPLNVKIIPTKNPQ